MSEQHDSNNFAERFKKTNHILASYNDFVCYIALEKETLVQVFWYEFVNDNLSNNDQNSAFSQLNLAKSISSPYLLNILSVGMTTKPPRFVVITEAVQSPILSEYVKTIETPPSTRTCIRWFKSLMLAVRAIHHSDLSNGHGNISPSLIYIKTTSGVLKLRMPISMLSCRYQTKYSVDFDVYKSPERLKGTLTKANDIWALGIIFLELLTHKPAYEEYHNPHELLEAISNHILPHSLSEISLKPALDLIKDCLRPELFRINIDDMLNNELFSDVNLTMSTQGFEKNGSIDNLL